jgi:hypothetical protein
MYSKSLTLLPGFIAIFITMLASAVEPPLLKDTMQGLRTETNRIAEGLLIGDFELVAEAADNITNHPLIPPQQVRLVATELGAEMPAFKQFDTLVHELSLSITAAAREGDRLRAIAAYHEMLDGCFSCHAAFRDRIAAVLGET